MKEASENISAGASAARDLVRACEASPAEQEASKIETSKIEAVRVLALDLERTLEGLAAEIPVPELLIPELLAEAAGKCADLATLAACNAEDLASPNEARNAVRLAAEAASSLSRAVEENTADDDLLLRDARSAAWKAALAVRQTEEGET